MLKEASGLDRAREGTVERTSSRTEVRMVCARAPRDRDRSWQADVMPRTDRAVVMRQRTVPAGMMVG